MAFTCFVSFARALRSAGLALLLASCAASQGNRATQDMQGGCEDYRLDVRREMALASSAGVRIAAAASARADAPFVPLEQKVTVELLPQSEVRFRLVPERRSESPERRAGVLQLRVARDGDYRISTSTAAWIDLIEPSGERLRPKKFEMQTQCSSVFKTVVFALRADAAYTMQVSASRGAALPLYIVPHGG